MSETRVPVTSGGNRSATRSKRRWVFPGFFIVVQILLGILLAISLIRHEWCTDPLLCDEPNARTFFLIVYLSLWFIIDAVLLTLYAVIRIVTHVLTHRRQ